MLQAHLTHKHSIGALKKEAGLKLLGHLMQTFRADPRALTEEQEQSILGVSGGAFIGVGTWCPNNLDGVYLERAGVENVRLRDTANGVTATNAGGSVYSPNAAAFYRQTIVLTIVSHTGNH